jgi:hypothetical protein
MAPATHDAVHFQPAADWTTQPWLVWTSTLAAGALLATKFLTLAGFVLPHILACSLPAAAGLLLLLSTLRLRQQVDNGTWLHDVPGFAVSGLSVAASGYAAYAMAVGAYLSPLLIPLVMTVAGTYALAKYAYTRDKTTLDHVSAVISLGFVLVGAASLLGHSVSSAEAATITPKTVVVGDTGIVVKYLPNGILVDVPNTDPSFKDVIIPKGYYGTTPSNYAGDISVRPDGTVHMVSQNQVVTVRPDGFWSVSNAMGSYSSQDPQRPPKYGHAPPRAAFPR